MAIVLCLLSNTGDNISQMDRATVQRHTWICNFGDLCDTYFMSSIMFAAISRIDAVAGSHTRSHVRGKMRKDSCSIHSD